jgi:hypothetical protein
VEAAHVDNALLADYFTLDVALEEPEIGSTDPNIPINNNWTDDKLGIGMLVGSGDFDNDGDESNERDAIPTVGWRRRATIERERFGLENFDVNGYEGVDGDDADELEEASQAPDESTKNEED